MILTTTPTIEGKSILGYFGPVGAEVIFGANFIKDWMAEGTDFWGGRNGAYEKVFADAREKALSELKMKVSMTGANAIVGLRFDYQVLGEKNGMMMVAVTGTAVQVILNKEEQAALNAAQKAHADAELPQFMVNVADKLRGPFSVMQLRDLVAAGRLTKDALTSDEDGKVGMKVGELIA